MATIRFESQESKGKQVPAELPYWTELNCSWTEAYWSVTYCDSRIWQVTWPQMPVCIRLQTVVGNLRTYELQDRAAEKFSVRRA